MHVKIFVTDIVDNIHQSIRFRRQYNSKSLLVYDVRMQKCKECYNFFVFVVCFYDFHLYHTT